MGHHGEFPPVLMYRAKEYVRTSHLSNCTSESTSEIVVSAFFTACSTLKDCASVILLCLRKSSTGILWSGAVENLNKLLQTDRQRYYTHKCVQKESISTEATDHG